MNNNISPVSHKGTFILETPSKAIRTEIASAVGNSNNMLANIYMGSGQALYVVRNNRDKKIADVIAKNSLQFQYFPNSINSSAQKKKSRLILTPRRNAITDIQTMLKMLNPSVHQFEQPEYSRALVAMEKAGISLPGHSVSTEQGVVIIKKGKKNVMRVSPENQYGISYVEVLPANPKKSPIRFSMDADGNTFIYSENSTKNFIHNFKEAKSYYKSKSNSKV